MLQDRRGGPPLNLSFPPKALHFAEALRFAGRYLRTTFPPYPLPNPCLCPSPSGKTAHLGVIG